MPITWWKIALSVLWNAWSIGNTLRTSWYFTIHDIPATEPLAYLSIDILRPHFESIRGNTALLVITDRFPTLSKTVLLRTTTAHDVADAITKPWFFLYGPPSNLLFDKEKKFTARFVTDVCRILGIANPYTLRFSPPSITTSLTVRAPGKNFRNRLHIRTILSRTVALALTPLN